MGKLKFFKSREGVAFIWVFMVFTIIMILMGSVIYITRQDILETANQEERLKTYYIALAGAELTYAGLMDEGDGLDKLPLEKVVDKFKNNPDLTPTPELIVVEKEGEKVGTATVSIDRVNYSEVNWIRITSIGKLENKKTKVSTTIRINEDIKNQVVREKFAQ